MIAALLSHAGLDPRVVVESDESDGSFLKLAAIVAVVTNIDREHLDHYGIRRPPSRWRSNSRSSRRWRARP